jgi:hypothetical protein
MVMNIQPRLSRLVILLVVLALAGLFSACARAAKKPPKFTEIEAQVQEMAKKRETYQKELAQMSPAQLYEILQKESLEGKEPYNSMAYSELVSRAEKASPELQSLLKQPDRSSLLGLLALRWMRSRTHPTSTLGDCPICTGSLPPRRSLPRVDPPRTA